MNAPFDPRLLDALERLVIPDWEGFVWRITVGETPVERPNTYGARWNPPGLDALYTSISRDGAIAELNYLLGRQPVVVRAKRKANRIRVKLGKVLDLSSETAAATLGFSLTDLKSDDVNLPQHIGAAAGWLELPGLLVPSARFATNNMVVLTKNLAPADIVDPVESEDMEP